MAGIQNRLTGGLSPGYGYTGVVVATLRTLTMPGVTLAALFIGDLTVGASSAAQALGIPLARRGHWGVLLLTTVALLALRRNRGGRAPRARRGTPRPPADVAPAAPG